MGLYKDLVYPWLVEYEMRRSAILEQRKILLERVEGRVLEVGFGTGHNLPFYPQRVKELAVVEPNLGMGRWARERLAASSVRVIAKPLTPENTLPFDTGDFDTVVCTWTICTIPGAATAVGEIARVLRPGGRYLYIEHGRSPDPRVARMQDLMNPLSKKLYDGCHVNRDIGAIVRSSGLSIAAEDRFYLRGTPRFCGYMYRGEARR